MANIPQERLANYPENVRGVLVTAVDPQAASASALQPGDVIEQINGQPVPSPDAFVKSAAALKSARVLLSIARGKVRSFVVIQVEG